MFWFSRSSGVGLIAALAVAATARAQTSYPMITHATPVAVQRGKTAEVTVEGQMNFEGVHTFLVEGKGITAEVLRDQPAPKEKSPPPKGKGARVTGSTKLKVSVASDAALGVREFRLASTLGISTLGQLLVTDDPVVLEIEPNNTPDKAQTIPVPAVVCGKIEAAEAVDCYRFKAHAGQTLTFEVYCARIQDKIHDLQKHADPLLTLFDKEGRELAANDDGRFADPLLSYTFPSDGEYVIQVRDTKYDGDPRWVYALHVTDKPYVAHIYPLAVNPGKPATVEPVGSARIVQPQITFEPPSEPGIHTVTLPVGPAQTNPTACIVTPLPLITEQEPNDTISQANRFAVPGGVNGRIGTKRDLDYFVFKGTKGKAVRFEVFARRYGTELQSQLDSMLEILNAQGAVLASNDDTNGKDSALVFAPPADGDFYVRIRDLNNKGGESFVYYLEADWAKPDFTLKVDPSKAMIGPGSRAAWYVQVARSNGFAGPVKIEVNGLPKHVSVNPLVIPPTMTQGLLVLSASADATNPDAANVDVIGTATLQGPDGKSETITHRATAVEEIYSPGGGRARFDVRMQSVAVTEATDILDVQVKPDKLVLKSGEEVKLDVTIRRRPDYDKSVSLDVLLRHLGGTYGNPLPPGVSIVEAKSKTLIGTGNTGHIVLKVEPNAAPIEDVPISVLAHVSINFVVKVSYSSAPILLTIKK
jgi:Bacterial pre-peptidase C-terminal domain